MRRTRSPAPDQTHVVPGNSAVNDAGVGRAAIPLFQDKRREPGIHAAVQPHRHSAFGECFAFFQGTHGIPRPFEGGKGRRSCAGMGVVAAGRDMKLGGERREGRQHEHDCP